VHQHPTATTRRPKTLSINATENTPFYKALAGAVRPSSLLAVAMPRTAKVSTSASREAVPHLQYKAS